MSILQYPGPTTTTNNNKNSTTQLQVWNNAAFDGEELQGFSFPMKTSWSSFHPSDSLGSDCTKENLSPAALNSPPVSTKSSITIKPLTVLPNSTKKNNNKGFEQEDEKKIDDEIEAIENEIKRLSARLEALRLEKAEKNAAKTVEKRGRIVPAKFLEPKQSVVKFGEVAKKIEDTPKAKVNWRRGVSLGPAEIFAGGGRSSSSRLVPPPGKADLGVVTPVPATQSRRKSCFWKLQEVDEEKAVSEKRKSLSRIHSIQAQRHAATATVGSRKCVKKEDAVIALVQPKKLFKEGEKSVPNKKPVKPGRVVASRYNQIVNANQLSGNNSVAVDVRKRSLPENDKDDDGKRCDKRRASSAGKSRGNNKQGSEVRMKKRWEIPAEVVVYKKSEEEEEKPLLLSSIADTNDVLLLPKISTLRCADESPRDSGAAKRVAELTGKRSYFCPDEEDVEGSVCQVLSFAEEDTDEEG